MNREWVYACVEAAVVALHIGWLAAEEFTSVCHEVVFIESHGEKDLSEMNRAAWRVVYNRADWWNQPVPGCSCVMCAGCSCAQCARPAVGLSTPPGTPGNSPEQSLAAPDIPSPEQQPQKKRPGRPKGSKDLVPRDRRGTQTRWDKAARSRNSRKNAKKRKVLLGQEQQQQTPPA